MPTPHYDEPLYAAVGRRYLDGDLNHTLEHPPVATMLTTRSGLLSCCLGMGFRRLGWLRWLLVW